MLPDHLCASARQLEIISAYIKFISTCTEILQHKTSSEYCCSESTVAIFRNINWIIQFPMIDPMTQVTQAKSDLFDLDI